MVLINFLRNVYKYDIIPKFSVITSETLEVETKYFLQIRYNTSVITSETLEVETKYFQMSTSLHLKYELLKTKLGWYDVQVFV